jgi:hypothetical protein
MIKAGEFTQAKALYDKAYEMEPKNPTLEAIRAKLR